MLSEQTAPFFGVFRHRINVDGGGVVTLAVMQGCPLRCRYCINPQCLKAEDAREKLTPQELYQRTRIDELYFLATEGGVTFGGGEPSLRSSFISEFRKLCGKTWKLRIETSLNVPQRHVEELSEVIDQFIIDIKDLNPEIYLKYTGTDNSQVLQNLNWLVENGYAGKVLIRLPHIPNHNTPEDVAMSRTKLTEMGFSAFDEFNYIIK